jgi:predicted dehydrogenase
MTIGVGVVGYGYWGPNVLRNVANTDGLVPVAICEIREERAKLALRSYPSVVVAGHYQEILLHPQVGAVAVVTPLASHYEIARAALLAGKHVLVGKPMTTSVEESEELCSLAKQRGLVLMVHHTFLFTGAVQKMKELVDSGAIGDLLYFDSVRVNLGLIRSDHNVLWDLAPDDLSILLYLLGGRPTAVSAIGACHVRHTNKDLATMAYLTLKMPSGVLAHIHVNWLSPVKVRQTLIGGTKRMIVYDDLEPDEKVKVYDKGVEITPGEAAYDVLVQYRTGDVHIPKLASEEALRGEMGHFRDCIRTGSRPRTDGEQGLEVVRILTAADTSLARDGELVRL